MSEQPNAALPPARRRPIRDWKRVADLTNWLTGETRQATCREDGCGVTYTQSQLTPQFMAAARQYDKRVDRDFPDGWTPDLCPKHARELNDAIALSEENRSSRYHPPARAARAPLKPPAETREFAW